MNHELPPFINVVLLVLKGDSTEAELRLPFSTLSAGLCVQVRLRSTLMYSMYLTPPHMILNRTVPSFLSVYFHILGATGPQVMKSLFLV